MFANWIDPVVKDYLFHDSPWHTPTGRRNFWIILAVVLVLSLLGWQYILRETGLLTRLAWLPLAVVGSIIGYAILSFLDRERRIRFFHFVTMFSVAFVTAQIGLLINRISPWKFWTVGFGEEAVKILPVVLLALYVPNLIRTKKDGLLYGALAGMGFNLIEISGYIIAAQHEGFTTIQALYLHLPRLGLWGLGGHIIWSAFAGLGVGYAVESPRTGWAKWRRAVIYYLIAAVAHSAFDLGASAIGLLSVSFVAAKFQGVDLNAMATLPESEIKLVMAQPGPMNTATRYGTYVYNLIFIIVLFIQIRRSFTTEQTIQVEELSSEAPAVMTEEELNELKAEKFFLKRRYKEYPRKVSNKLVLYQNLLAMQKHTARQEGHTPDNVEPVPALRQAIQSLRGEV